MRGIFIPYYKFDKIKRFIVLSKKHLIKQKEEFMKNRKLSYWHGLLLGFFVFALIITGIYLPGKTHSNPELFQICTLLFVIASAVGIIGSIVLAKEPASTMQYADLLAPYEVGKHKKTRPFLRGLFNSLLFLPVFTYLVIIIVITLLM